MSENFGYIDIILLAIMAGFILLRLRSTLGKGADNMPMKARFTQSSANDVKQEFDKSVLEEQNLKDPLKFDEKTFIKGAEAAYEMIINAFANSERKTLRQLLSKDLFKNFDSVIKEREEKKIKSEMTFIGIKETKILDIDQKDTLYKVKTKFVSEIINCLKKDNIASRPALPQVQRRSLP